MMLIFNANGDFVAAKEAEAWCERHGLSVGLVDGNSPRGILFGNHAIPKWHNLRQADKDALHGTMTGNMREGFITVAVDAHAVRRAGGMLLTERLPPDEMCACGDRPAALCLGPWEPGCDLGANEKFVKVGASDADRLKALAPEGLPKVPDEVMQYPERPQAPEAHDGSGAAQPQPEDLRLRIKVKRELFSFRSQQEWVNKAKSWYANCGYAGPDPELIRSTRDGVCQTQAQAAAVVCATERTWQDWEAGRRGMPLVAWQVYVLHHCLPGGMLLPDQWAQWLRPEWLSLLNAASEQPARTGSRTRE